MTRGQLRQRGSASVEIVVMLPVMIILFFAVYHFYGRGRAELTTSKMARACAWQYVMSGCDEQVGASSFCTGLGMTRGGDVEQKEEGQTKDPAPEDGTYRRAKEQRASAFGTLEEIPVVKQITEFLFGEVASASASVTTKKFRRADELRTRNQIYLVCNTAAKPWGEMIKDALCSMADRVIGEGAVPGC